MTLQRTPTHFEIGDRVTTREHTYDHQIAMKRNRYGTITAIHVGSDRRTGKKETKITVLWDKHTAPSGPYMKQRLTHTDK